MTILILGLLAMLLLITPDVAAARDIKKGQVVKSTKKEVGGAKFAAGFPPWVCPLGCCFWTAEGNCFSCCATVPT
ncbi:hypothetical protein VNO78_16117 [Psophocarpus tetragonolobus]|uniref:Uncharacterized protein n=1 Tax=Psophocarpus tetragonolobus TaxID=3891 RepID=A0AAN9SG59_PSOTE